MKIRFIVIIALLCSGTVCAQDTLKQYLHSNGSVIKNAGDARPYYYRETYQLNGRYYVSDFYIETGALAKKGVYADEYLEVPNGVLYEYHENRQLASKIPYLNGKVDGLVLKYDTASKLTDSLYMLNGIPVGRTVEQKNYATVIGTYDTRGMGSGMEQVYYDGRLVVVGYYSAGHLKDSVWTSYHKNGIVAGKYSYTKDSLITTQCYDSDGKPEIYCIAEAVPGFNGNIYTYLSQNVRYPPNARRNGKEGRALVQFTVNEDGSITNVRAVSPIDEELNQEAIRVVSLMPNWKPATLYNVPVKFLFTLPVRFTLQ